MFNRLKEYINDNEFRLTVFSDRVHVMNFLNIVSLEEERISFLTSKGRVIIKGKNLCLNKLLDDEVLISGTIMNIEVDFDE